MSWRGVKTFATSVIAVFSRDTVRKKRLICTRDYEPGDTYRYIWQKSPDVKPSYVIYRIVHAALMLILLLISFFHLFIDCPWTTENKERYTCLGKYAQVNPAWPFYFTRWGLMLNFVQALMGLIFVWKAYSRQSRNQQKTNHGQPSRETSPKKPEHVKKSPEPVHSPHKPSLNSTVSAPKNVRESSKSRPDHSFLTLTGTYWGIHSLATSLTIIIDVVYWVALHNYSKEVTMSYFYYVSEHGANFVLMAIDNFVVAFPMLMLHIAHLVIFGSLHAVVSFTYYQAGGLNQKFNRRYLYHFVDWAHPLQACTSYVGILTITVFIFLLLMLLDFGKHKYFRPRQRGRSTQSRNGAV